MRPRPGHRPVAAGIEPGPWIAHTSGGTPLAALAPHARRFSLHPLQTFTHDRGPEQLDGAWAAVAGETDEAIATGTWLADTLGLRPFVLDDSRRALYHAGAAIASNYLVTLRRAAGELFDASGVPGEALEPLMRRVIENGFQLTGPIERGDWERSSGIAPRSPRPHRTCCPPTTRSPRSPRGTPSRRGRRRDRHPFGRRTRAALSGRRDGRIGLVPTMGALHDGHRALLQEARTTCETVVMSLFVNPAQFGDAADLNGYPRDEARDLETARDAGVDVVFAPPAAELYPPGYQTWVEVTELGAVLEGEHRPGHFRAVATVCLKLFTIVRPDVVFFGQKDAQQVEVLRRMISDLHLELALEVVPTVRDADGLALSSRNARLSAEERARALALPRALATHDPETARSILDAAGLEVEYVALAPFDPPTLAAAVRVGTTRLIDNLPLEEES